MTTPYLATTGAARDAIDLIARYGTRAAGEATMRAAHSRDRGNHLHFCRWREAGRLIEELLSPGPVGTRH